MRILTGAARVLAVKETPLEFFSEHHIESVSELVHIPRMALPTAFSLKSNMSGIRDQGFGETCVSFAAIAALEYVHGRIDLSEADITNGAERAYDDCRPGLGLVPPMQYCSVSGVVSESDWPYDEKQICWAHPPDTTGKPHFRFSRIAAVFHRPSAEIHRNMAVTADPYLNKREHLDLLTSSAITDSVKSALVQLARPVVLDVPVWFTILGHFDAGWDRGPDVHMPTPVHVAMWLEKNANSPGNVDGWHAIPICGYDDSTGRFEFKNSWGFWGNAGYGTIPYQYVETYSRTGMQGWG
jgi:hypothetical protein